MDKKKFAGGLDTRPDRAKLTTGTRNPDKNSKERHDYIKLGAQRNKTRVKAGAKKLALESAYLAGHLAGVTNSQPQPNRNHASDRN